MSGEQRAKVKEDVDKINVDKRKEGQEEEQHQQAQEDNGHQDDSTNLDAGYAWFILLIMFLLQSSISGASRVYGIVYAKQVAVGYYDREEASTPIATASAIENLAGVLTPALAQYLSWRKIELLSTLLFVGANLLAYFSSSLAVDILALGIVQGLALSTSTVLSLAINNDYFERYRTTAYGISMSGSTFGVLYLSPLASWLLRDYDDFRLVYLMLSVVFSVNILLVFFIKPRAKTIKRSGKPQEGGQEDEHELERDLSQLRGQLSRFESRFERQNSIASISYRARSRRQSVLSRTMTAASELSAGPTGMAAAGNTNTNRSAASSMRLARRTPLGASPSQKQMNCCLQMDAGHLMLAKSVSVGGNLFQEPPSKKISINSVEQQIFMAIDSKLAPDADKKPDEMHEVILSKLADLEANQRVVHKKTSVAFNCLDEKEEQEDKKRPAIKPKTTTTTSEFSMQSVLALLRLPYLHCAWIMLALYYLIARIFIIILVDFADDHGFSLTESTNLLNYWSLGELFGRIFLGSLIDLKWMSCKSCISLTCSLIGALILTMSLVESYYVYATCSLFIAALISLEYMLINVMIVEYLGKSSVTSCYSIAAFISSLILFARPTLIGLFRDQLGSYDGLLWLLASISLAYALLVLLLEPLTVRRWPKTGEIL